MIDRSTKKITRYAPHRPSLVVVTIYPKLRASYFVLITSSSPSFHLSLLPDTRLVRCRAKTRRKRNGTSGRFISTFLGVEDEKKKREIETVARVAELRAVKQNSEIRKGSGRHLLRAFPWVHLYS